MSAQPSDPAAPIRARCLRWPPAAKAPCSPGFLVVLILAATATADGGESRNPDPQNVKDDRPLKLVDYLHPALFVGYGNVGYATIEATCLGGIRNDALLFGAGPNAGIAYGCYSYGLGAGIGFLRDDVAMSAILIVDRKVAYRDGPIMKDGEDGDEVKLHLGVPGIAVEVGYMRYSGHRHVVTFGVGVGF